MLSLKRMHKYNLGRNNQFLRDLRWFCFCAFVLGQILLLSYPCAYAEESVTMAVVGPMIGTRFSVGKQYKVGVAAAIQALPDGDLVATAIRGGPIESILGAISFDEKGDINISYPAFAWYMWKSGKRVALD